MTEVLMPHLPDNYGGVRAISYKPWKEKPRVLLVNVADPWLTNGGDRPSLGTLYLASWIRHKNVAEPSVIDLNHAKDEGLIKRMDEFKPDIVGISLTTPQYEESVRIAGLLKQNYNVPIIAGGPHPSAMQNVSKVPELMPKEQFDYVVIGNGLFTLEQICKEGLPQDRIIRGQELPREKDLDWLPMPARDLVDMGKYSLKMMGKKAQPLMTSFGCPYKCSFCSEPQLNNRFKAHSPKRVIEEMKQLVNLYGTEALIIYDDVFSIDVKRAMEIGDLMKSEGLSLKYRATMRATDFVRKPELADKLAESGCLEACVGLESGSDDVLKLNDKGMSVENNRLGIKMAQKAGLRVLTYMITGLPGCTPETERRGLEFIQQNEVAEFGWYMLAPFPSTGIWVHRNKFGLEVFEDEIIANKWDVAQCRSDNENLTCYISYEKSGGMNRYQIKETWLGIIGELDKWKKAKGMKGIQEANENQLEAVK